MTAPVPFPAPGPKFIEKRSGKVAPFEAKKIRDAVFKCLTNSCGYDPQQADPLSWQVASDVTAVFAGLPQANIEHVQDAVEKALLAEGLLEEARQYMTYRHEHRTARAHYEAAPGVHVRHPDDSLKILVLSDVVKLLRAAGCPVTPAEEVGRDVLRQAYDGITEAELWQLTLLTVRSRFDRCDPVYDGVARNLLLHRVYSEVERTSVEGPYSYHSFRDNLEKGVETGKYDIRLIDGRFDLNVLAFALDPDRDVLFQYAGLHDLCDRYLRRLPSGQRIEAPQSFWMRVAMGVSLNEADPTRRAIEAYEVFSTFRYVPSTPTLFNAGTLHPQLSSCFLTTVEDDLYGIFKAVSDNSMLSKWAGGLGNDWTPVRAEGTVVKGTGGKSKGVVPFLKVANAAAAAVTQGEIRKGALCAYLEPWHLDFEMFLDLRRETGEERLRTHDIHTAVWTPDLFFQRVKAGQSWTLFCPSECPDLHDLYGKAFKDRYEFYEREAAEGRVKRFKTVDAMGLWRHWLSRIYETGHPWVTFKDPANLRNPQQHRGVVHSSNLCTEILLNTDKDRTAVCNLGSVNLLAHVDRESLSGLDEPKVAETVRVAMRCLDNVIDLTYYPIPEAKRANQEDRPVGLGQMGFQDALYALGIDFASEAAVRFADLSTELLAFHALSASADLAVERGRYSTYEGSLWSHGIFPQDTLGLVATHRGEEVKTAGYSLTEHRPLETVDWALLRAKVAQTGLRNSHWGAVAPTATISGIVGVRQSIEPQFEHIYAKSAMGGDFTVVNWPLFRELRDRGLFDQDLVEDIKRARGRLSGTNLPEDVKRRYPSAFEIDPRWLIKATAARMKWYDHAVSLNLYVDKSITGKQMHEMYLGAWEYGLKTTYYMRARAASGAEQSTVAAAPKAAPVTLDVLAENVGRACAIDAGSDCEACQ